MQKKWIYLAIGLVIVAAAVLLFDKPNPGPKVATDQLSHKLGDLVLVDQIKIRSHLPDQELILQKQGDVWQVLADHYPVDGQNLSRLFDQLTSLKVVDSIGEGANIEQEAGMDQGQELSLLQGDKVVTHLIIGKTAARGGQYIKTDAAKVLLLSQPLRVSADVSQWELKDFLQVDAEQIRELEISQETSGKAKTRRYVYNTEKKALILEGAKCSDKESDVTPLTKALTKLSYQKRLDSEQEEAKTAIATRPSRIKVMLADGSKFELVLGEIGREHKKYYAAIRKLERKDATTKAGLLSLLQDQYPHWIFEINEDLMKRLLPAAS